MKNGMINMEDEGSYLYAVLSVIIGILFVWISYHILTSIPNEYLVGIMVGHARVVSKSAANFDLSPLAKIVLLIFFSLMIVTLILMVLLSDTGASFMFMVLLLVIFIVAIGYICSHNFSYAQDALKKGASLMSVIYFGVTVLIMDLLFWWATYEYRFLTLTNIILWGGLILDGFIYRIPLEFSFSLLLFPLGFAVGASIAEIIENTRIKRKIMMEEERRRIEEERRRIEEERRRRMERERKIRELKRKIEEWKEEGYDVRELERKLREVEENG